VGGTVDGEAAERWRAWLDGLWLRSGSASGAENRGPWPVAVSAALLAASCWLNVFPAAKPDELLGVAVRVGLGTWAALLVVQIAAEVVSFRGAGAGATAEREWLPGVCLGPGLATGYIMLAGAALMAAALQRAPSRLVVNLLGYGLTAVPVLWAVRRLAGPAALPPAAALLVMFGLLPTSVEVRGLLPVDLTRPGSAFLWDVGWPEPDWVLRQRIALPPSGAARAKLLRIRLATAYDGPARILVSVNGAALGAAEMEEHRSAASLLLAPSLLEGTSELSVELRLRPFDPELRLAAHRWSGAATMREEASAYFDTVRWWPGTFDVRGGQQRAGVYLIQLEEVR
jgi:hypothetical protein